MSDLSFHTAPNGLRMVHSHCRGAKVDYTGVMVNVGSRDEDAGSYGLAHFVEHTIFKGTSKRSSWQIANRMESVGGELNAYTTKEETMVYTNAPSGHEERAMEILADLITHSNFPKEEIDRERDVIIEEINSYRNNPAESVYDDFDDLIYAGSDLGHNILGTPETVSEINGIVARSFVDTYYAPQNMVLYYRAPHSPERAFRLAEKYFGGLDHPMPDLSTRTPEILSPFDKKIEEEDPQANTVTGCRLFGRGDRRRHALFLLNNYFGGPCMNSLLNRELRDKRGLVYTADSSVALLSDTGTLQIYYGTGEKEVKRCQKLINSLLERLATRKLTDRSLEAIKRQYIGQLIVGTEHNESMAMNLAKSTLYFGSPHSPRETIEAVSRVTAQELQEIAGMIVDRGLSRLTIA